MTDRTQYLHASVGLGSQSLMLRIKIFLAIFIVCVVHNGDVVAKPRHIVFMHGILASFAESKVFVEHVKMVIRFSMFSVLRDRSLTD